MLLYPLMSPDLRVRLDAIVAQLAPQFREQGQRDVERLAALGVSSVADMQQTCTDPAAPADARAIVCWGLGRLGDAGALDTLVAALGDPDPAVRWEAARALGELDDRRAVEPLAAALAGDAGAGVRATAAGALGLIGDRGALAALAAGLAPGEPEQVRAACAEAFGDLWDPEAEPALITALDDPSPSVRHAAANALCQSGSPRALPKLREIAACDHGTVPQAGSVREAAARAIVKLEGMNREPG